MKAFFNSFWRKAQTLIAVAAFAGAIGGIAYSQGFVIPANTPFIGHYIAQGPIPVGAGCTIQASATDTDGQCTTSAASGSITFGTPFAAAPFCMVVDASATSTVSMPVYTVSTTAITLTTIITAHTLFWHCAAKAGG